LASGAGIEDIDDRPGAGIRKIRRQVEGVGLFAIGGADHAGNYRADRKGRGDDLREGWLRQDQSDDQEEDSMHSNKIDVAVIGKQGGALRSLP
jgi:hypothetical protein